MVWLSAQTANGSQEVNTQSRLANAGADSVQGAADAAGHKIYIWDLQTREILQKLEGHKDCVLTVAVSQPFFHFQKIIFTS